MRRRLITGKYVEQRCDCNSTWIVGQGSDNFTPTRTQVTFMNSIPKHIKGDGCPKCGLWPWVEGERDIALVREAILLARSQEEAVK